MSVYPHAFEGRVARHAIGRYAYTVLWLPEDLTTALGLTGGARLRVEGEAAEQPVSGAWQPSGGRWFFMLSKAFLRHAEVAVGDVVEMRFAVADPEAVDAPPELARAVEADREAAAAWAALGAGARRGFAYRVASAKTAPTRARRVVEVMEMLRRGERPGPPSAKRRRGPAATAAPRG